MLSLLPPLSFDRCFWAPCFAGEACSAQSSSHGLPAVACADALVSRVGSSLATGTVVPVDAGGSVFVDGAGPSSLRGFRLGTPAPDLHLCSDTSRSGWAHASLITSCPGCNQSSGSCSTSIFLP